MVRSVILAVGGAFFITVANGQLQLVPTRSESDLDGIKLEQLSFSGDKKEITYQAPRGWACFGSPHRLVLRPKNEVHAEATITSSPLSEPADFNENGVKKLVQQALASPPAGSTNSQLLSQEKNTVIIAHKETVLITLSYVFYGETYGRSVMFMNRGEEQFCFQLTARLGDFEQLQRVFHASHFTWQNL